MATQGYDAAAAWDAGLAIFNGSVGAWNMNRASRFNALEASMWGALLQHNLNHEINTYTPGAQFSVKVKGVRLSLDESPDK